MCTSSEFDLYLINWLLQGFPRKAPSIIYPTAEVHPILYCLIPRSCVDSTPYIRCVANNTHDATSEKIIIAMTFTSYDTGKSRQFIALYPEHEHTRQKQISSTTMIGWSKVPGMINSATSNCPSPSKIGRSAPTNLSPHPLTPSLGTWNQTSIY